MSAPERPGAPGGGLSHGTGTGASVLVNRSQMLLLFAVANLLPALTELLHNVLTDMDSDVAPLLDAADRIGDLLMAVATTASARSYLASWGVLKGNAGPLSLFEPTAKGLCARPVVGPRSCLIRVDMRGSRRSAVASQCLCATCGTYIRRSCSRCSRSCGRCRR